MLTTVLCSRCVRCINHFPVSILQIRSVSTTNETSPSSLEDDNDTNRNISRLTDDVYRQFKGLPPIDVREQYHTRTKLRTLWGKYGRKTGIDPKLCWPTQDEMDEIIDDERVYNMKLSEKLKIVNERREAKQKEFDQIQAKVEKNLKTMPKMIDDYRKRTSERERAKSAEIKVKSDLAEQARDFYGFSVDPDDERMQFMLLQLEEAQKAEDKKARKAAKKLEAHQQLQKLMGMGSTAEGTNEADAAAPVNVDPLAAIPDAKEKETDMKLFAKLVSERSKLAKAASKIAEEQAAVQLKGQKKK
ncbi:unnamed protein product [Rotaria magnacalcarata]|uniref:Large ribosomal subunit protein mL64 n=2 Tax=Rotaria magnacalcarata TaxID=392030 RepID=A0A816UTX1_9BILA|nr:unnamed protein product [Rotaria magnacalcarata]CAF1574278.1 unnamed protein product [Rotaria magnacalcarata]CAF2115276.1 unnamed protein product [Rotaria magnacalcarata]CAF4611506.1 unnamed protein product [Rotaria magnacalcarata]